MKAVFATFLVVLVCLAFGACESELPPNTSTIDRFERGVVGQGTLTQPDRSEDPVIKENTRVGF